MAHLSGASGDACAARKLACTDSAQVEGRRRAGPKRNPPPAHGRRREAALQMRRSEAEGRFGEAEPEGCASIRAEWRRAEKRRAPVPTARPTAPAAERSDAKCAGPGSDRTRTQSNDCGAGRARCGTVHFVREYRWGGGPRTLTGTAHRRHTRHTHDTARMQERTIHATCAYLRNSLTHYVPTRAGNCDILHARYENCVHGIVVCVRRLSAGHSAIAGT